VRFFFSLLGFFSVLVENCVYLHREQMKDGIKIVKRQCKEAGIFPGTLYLSLLDYIENSHSYVFYGLDGVGYSTAGGVECEIKMLKLQFNILKSLIEKGLLEKNDYLKALNDTLTRYNIRNSVGRPWREDWKRVVEETDKKDFVEFFFKAFEENVGHLTASAKNIILEGLPRN
jgi:hypothetical protein